MIFLALAREFLSVLGFNWIKACESSFLQLPFSINNLRQLESILESFSLSSGAHQSILAERVAEEYEEYEEPSKCKVSSSRVQETTRGMTKDFVAVHRRKKVLLFSATVSIPDLVIPRQATLPSNRSVKVVRLDSVCSASEIMAELEREKASNP